MRNKANRYLMPVLLMTIVLPRLGCRERAVRQESVASNQSDRSIPRNPNEQALVRRSLEQRGITVNEKVFLRILDGTLRSDYADAPLEFLRAGISPNTSDPWGQTALMYAAEAGNLPVVQMLLQHGANVNAKDEGGNTALHYSATSNSNSVPFILLAAGANINAINMCGETPLDRAEGDVLGPNLRLSDGLRQAGAKSGPGTVSTTEAERRRQWENLADLVAILLSKHDNCEAYRALRFIRRRGSPSEHFDVAIRYMEGKRGFPTDVKRANAWLELAAEESDPQATAYLAKRIARQK